MEIKNKEQTVLSQYKFEEEKKESVISMGYIKENIFPKVHSKIKRKIKIISFCRVDVATDNCKRHMDNAKKQRNKSL